LPVNKNYRLLNILRNADVNKVGRPSSAVAELLLLFIIIVIKLTAVERRGRELLVLPLCER